MVSASFICKCGKQGGYIAEGETKKPCPSCGRVYRGEYSQKKTNHFTD